MADNFGNGDAIDMPMGKAAVDRLIKENSHIFSDTSCKVCSAALNSESQKLAHYQSKKHANKFRRYISIQQGEDDSPAKKKKADDALMVSVTEDRNKFCPICNMSFSSPVVAMSHYEGRVHSRNLKLKEQCGTLEGQPPSKKSATPLPSADSKTPGTTDESDPDQFCSLCKATFNNPLMAEQHYMGKKHKKHETKCKLMTVYTSSGNTLPQTTPLKPLKPGSGSTGNGFTCDICNIVVNSIEQYQAHITGSKHKNNLMTMVTTSTDKLSTPSDRKSFHGVSSSSRLFSSETPYTGSNFSSSTSGLPSSSYYSSSSGGFSSSGGYSSSGPLSSSSGPLSSSSGPLLSSSGTLSSSYGLSSVGRYSSGGGLLPRPSYASQTYQTYVKKDTINPDGYNYLSQGY